MGPRTWVLAALALCASLATAGAWYIKAHGFSARAKPLAIEAFIARHVRLLAIPSAAKGLTNPLSVNPVLLAQARDHYADHCAVCHGNRGDGRTLIGQGLYPPVPDFRQSIQELSDGEIFYIIKNGVRFTGMPGFGGSDEENWKLVSFVRHLPALPDEEMPIVDEVTQRHSHGTDDEHH